MKDGKVFKVVLTLLFIAFLTLYVSQATGYYDYQQYQKKELTAEKMKQFEEDVKAGKNIDITNYLETNIHNYNNGVSLTSLKLSTVVKHYVQKSIGGAFGLLDRLLNN
jgi:ABC-type dipeptide/oligopeptide/nickel transport system permease component